MKVNKFFVGAFALVIVAIAGINVSLNTGHENISAMKRANIKALSQESGGGNSIICYCTYRTTSTKKKENIWTITKCNGCTEVDVFECRDSSTCTSSGGVHWVFNLKKSLSRIVQKIIS